LETNLTNIMELLSPRCIKVPLESREKREVIGELIELLVSVKKLPHREVIFDALIEREEFGSTGIGHGVALPHAKCPEAKDIYLACGLSPQGINFDALDRELVYIFFLILYPPTASGRYLKVMSILNRILIRATAREELLRAKTGDEVYAVLYQLNESLTTAGSS